AVQSVQRHGGGGQRCALLALCGYPHQIVSAIACFRPVDRNLFPGQARQRLSGLSIPRRKILAVPLIWVARPTQTSDRPAAATAASSTTASGRKTRTARS